MIENPMVIDRLWRFHEEEPKVAGECPGCEKDITYGEDILEFEFAGETVLLHQDSECAYQFVAAMAMCKVAGE